MVRTQHLAEGGVFALHDPWLPGPEAAALFDALRDGIAWRQVSTISSQRRILTKSRWNDPYPSSSRAPAATTSIAQDLLHVIFKPSS